MAVKPISISLSPNVEKDDVRLALSLIFQPWLWGRGKAIAELENEFKKYLGMQYAVSFNSGRSSLQAILHGLGLQKGDEVLLQAFTCNAVPNPVLWEGLRPVYVDCREDDFNIDPVDLEKKITPRSRVVIVQHTFGLPADVEKILEICNRRNLILIEDCAHALGAKYKGRLVGTFGKAAFFSFSRDKVISCVYGGMAVTNDNTLAAKIAEFRKEAGFPSRCWTFQQLLHPILLQYVILPVYNFLDLGKIFLVVSQWLHILSKAVSWKEKRGKKPGYFPKALPNGLAVLAFHQFQKLQAFNVHRARIAAFYREQLANTFFELPVEFGERENVFLRFTIKHKRAHELLYEAWHKQNILLGDWYTTPIAPHDTKLNKVGYAPGTCPIAEKLANITLNLPTHINISPKEAQKIVDFLKTIL